MSEEAEIFIVRALRKQLGLWNKEIPREKVEKILAEHGFRKSTELKKVLVAELCEWGSIPLKKDLSEKFWINDNEGCLKIEDSIRMWTRLDTCKNSHELSEEDQEKEGLCFIVELSGVRHQKEVPEWILEKGARETLEMIIKKGEESEAEVLEKIEKEMLLQTVEEETREKLAKTIREGKKHETIIGEKLRIGEEIEVNLTLPVKIIVKS